MRNKGTVAVTIGASSLDENKVQCKDLTVSRTFMKSKPVKFGIRFGPVVGWSHYYVHSIFDNESRNRTGYSKVDRYVTLFRQLRGSVPRHMNGSIIDQKVPSGL